VFASTVVIHQFRKNKYLCWSYPKLALSGKVWLSKVRLAYVGLGKDNIVMLDITQ
jgi:hypothetical protein